MAFWFAGVRSTVESGLELGKDVGSASCGGVEGNTRPSASVTQEVSGGECNLMSMNSASSVLTLVLILVLSGFYSDSVTT
eukprot:g72686.t1